MGLSSRLVIGGLAGGVALTYYVRKQRRDTGAGYVEILRRLPSDAQRWAGQARRRVTLALESGRIAAQARDAEFTRALSAASVPPNAGG
jgi:hypothetical protein